MVSVYRIELGVVEEKRGRGRGQRVTFGSFKLSLEGSPNCSTQKYIDHKSSLPPGKRKTISLLSWRGPLTNQRGTFCGSGVWRVAVAWAV